MTGWLEGLHAELGRAGIRGRRRRRIELELADHLASDPASEARLGTPKEVAERFATELSVVRTRRAAWVSFGALALAGLGFLATLRAYAAAGGWPDVPGLGFRGTFVVPATGVVILVACQVAFVAGMLGLARTLRIRRRREPAPSELALVQRRMSVAVAAAALTSACLLVHAVALWGHMPWWWDAIALVSATLPLAALALAESQVRSARALTPAGGPPPAGLDADLPGWVEPRARGLLARPWLLAALVGGAASVIMLAGSAHAEGSLLEGAERGLVEAIAFFGCFAALGRPLGLRAQAGR